MKYHNIKEVKYLGRSMKQCRRCGSAWSPQFYAEKNIPEERCPGRPKKPKR